MSFMGDPDFAIKSQLMPGVYGQGGGGLSGGGGLGGLGGVVDPSSGGGGEMPQGADPAMMQLANQNAQSRAQAVSQALQEGDAQQADNQSSMNNVAQKVMDRYLNAGSGTEGFGTANSLLATTPEMMAGGGTFAGATPSFGMAGYGGASQLANLGMASSAGGQSYLGGLGANAAFQSGAMAPVSTYGGSILGGGGVGGAGAAGASGVGGAGGAGGGAAAAGGMGLGAIGGIFGGVLAGMHLENNKGVNTWGEQLRDFGGSSSRRGDMVKDYADRWFGDNAFGDRAGDFLSSPGKLFSGRPSEMWAGVKDAVIDPLTLWGALDPSDWF